jgi:hypothetical protein
VGATLMVAAGTGDTAPTSDELRGSGAPQPARSAARVRTLDVVEWNAIRALSPSDPRFGTHVTVVAGAKGRL